ncbi:MAG: alpha/beta hydrolase [Arenicellales bacterium]
MKNTFLAKLALLSAVLIIAGCASKPRQLMPTPLIYQDAGSVSAVVQHEESRGSSTDVDLLYITNRARESDPESVLPYGQTRSSSVAFGSARVQIGPDVSWDSLERESRLAVRTRDLNLSLGEVKELGRFPTEPYNVEVRADGLYRNAADLRAHYQAKHLFQSELEKRLARSKTKNVIVYVHGFNETFATAAYTAAEMCHFLGRDSVCVLYTWPSSSTGNFLTSYTSTTESARYAEDHLRKMMRMLGSTPGLKGVQLLAHSRGAALLMSTLRSLFTESVAAGKEPIHTLHIDNLVLFSPDIDYDLFAQDVTAGLSDPDMFSVWPSEQLPRSLRGRLTVYSSPNDRALIVSQILFRSRMRIGNVRTENIPEAVQDYLKIFDKLDIIIYQGDRTDSFGHSYFTTNPRVSSDIVQLLRFGKKLGDPGRELIELGPILWKFPSVDK